MIPPKKRHRYFSHVRETVHLSIPVIIGQLGQVLMQMIDNLMIGGIGYTYLSACSLATSVFFIIIVLGFGITSVISPLVAERLSSGHRSTCGALLYQGLWVGMFAGIILTGLIYVSSHFLYVLNQPASDVLLASSYTRILSYSVLPMLLFLVYKQFSDGLGRTRLAMIITILGLCINTLFNYLLINGYGGFPRLELDGAGYGTLISRISMLIMMIWCVQLGPRYKEFLKVNLIWKIDKNIIYNILRLGIPAGFQYLFEAGAFAGAAIMIGWIGNSERAAHQIVINLASATYMVVMGLSAGAGIRVGAALGRRNLLEAREAGLTGIWISIVFMVVASVVFIWGRYFFPTFYVEDKEVIEFSANLMIIAAFFQIFDGIQAVGIGILRGIQDVKVPTLITFASYWLLALPMGYVMGFVWNLSLNGVWFGLVLGLFTASVALTSRFLSLTTS